MVQDLNEYINNHKNIFMPNTLRQVKDEKRYSARLKIQNQIEKIETNEEEGSKRRNILVDIIGK